MPLGSSVIYFLLFFILFALSIKDFKEEIIPDGLLILLALLSLFQLQLSHGFSVFLLGTLGYGLYWIYPLLKGHLGLGLGDVKMLAVSGLWIDPSSLPLFLCIGGGAGILIALLWRLLYKNPRFPLGPALALSLGICTIGDNTFSLGEIKMSQTFSGPTYFSTEAEKPTSLVVLIHGYGADGEDLLSLGKAWTSLLPKTVFVAPHGPFSCEINSSGKQWFGLRDWDPSRILKEIQSITPAFNRYLDGLLKLYNLPPEKLALVGFSQGAMLALHVALLRPRCGGVVAYSGAFINDPKELKVASPPVLLIHGTEDGVLPASFSETAEKQLKSMGIPVTLSLLPHLSHGIDERGLEMGGAFLKEHLYGKDETKQQRETR